MVSKPAAASLLHSSATPLPASPCEFGFGHWTCVAVSPPSMLETAGGVEGEEEEEEEEEAEEAEVDGEEVLVLTNRLCRRTSFRVALRADGAVVHLPPLFSRETCTACRVLGRHSLKPRRIGVAQAFVDTAGRSRLLQVILILLRNPIPAG